ncbi:tRNA1(Val) (adenine(37)-N6)-methyltransferase [bioreactor metagenome]|uniref:tRNA1(Val) (Adenine(37)-N6)-methyltransferase n=1 Tax=bioreactor metagenome TaxID=1076179 RepID=A0A645CCW7_9ZZZZ|nr:methyltransferase [Oscillospiraceae bacterium]
MKRLDEICPGHSIYQYSDGFSYGTDAVLLTAFTRFKPGASGAELGTGTGVIPVLLCVYRRPKKIYSFEIQSKYASVAAENAGMNDFSNIIEVIEGDYLDASRHIPLTGLDFVVSNPPYMKSTSGYLNAGSDKLIARHEIKADIYGTCLSASKLLKNGGELFMVYRPDRMSELFAALKAARLEPKELVPVETRPREAPKLILCRAKKDALPSMKLRESFRIYDDNGELSDGMRRVYSEYRI